MCCGLSGKVYMFYMVFVVEDDFFIVDIVVFILDRVGYFVYYCSNGDVVFVVFDKFIFDIIVLDVGLFGCDGLDICKLI